MISGIFEYPEGCGNWYIVRCMKHNLNWGDKPLPAASRHLVSRWHMFSSKKVLLAIKKLGELVESCDQQKAEASNTEYKKALGQGYKPQNTMEKTLGSQRKRKSATKKADVKSGQELVGSFKGVIDPVVGKVYYAWWDSEPTSWYMVVILPYLGDGDWKEVGITGNLFTSGLRKEIPNCFKVTKVNTDCGKEALRLTWAEGYQDGGPKVRARRFPCLFLHEPLTIPSADQDFVLAPTAQVLAFRTAQQLRQMSTVLAPGLSRTGVDDNKGLARDFEARLGTIRAKQNPTLEQDVEDIVGVQALSLRDQQHLNVTTSVEAKEPPCASPASNVQDLHHHSTGSDLSMPGDGNGLAARNPRVSLPSRLGNSLIGKYGSDQGFVFDQFADRRAYPSVTLTTSTTHSPSPNDEECSQSRAKSWSSQATSRQAQPMATRPQNEGSPVSMQGSSNTSQTAVCPTPRPRGAVSSDRDYRFSTMKGHSSVQDMHDASSESHGRIQETDLISKTLNCSRESMGTTISLEHSKGLKATKVGTTHPSDPQDTASVLEASAPAGEARGPTALRPLIQFRTENERQSDGLLQEDRAPCLRNTVSKVERDAVPGSAGQTSWTPAYSAMLRDPWRSPNEGGRRPKNR